MPSENKEKRAMVRGDGTYPTVPLKKDTISIAIAQTRVKGVDGKTPHKGIRKNLDYLLECIDIAQGFGGRSDLICFHEFPITGFSNWSKEEHYKVAIEIPGAETEEIGKKCKEHGCYIVFGTYAKDPDWPEHILHLMVMINPEGDVVAKHWKQRNVRGMFPGSEQYTSAIYDVYDRFIEMYGQDQVIPVIQTDIGNIAMSAVQFEPELFRCMAFKGAEIICRVATGGFEPEEPRLTSSHTSLYTLIANNSLNTGERNPGFFDDSNYGGPGRSAIFGPRGIEIAKAGAFETKIAASIPIKAFREKHRIPDLHLTLYQPVFDQYQERYDSGLYLKTLPKNKQDAYKRFLENARWVHYW
jgi:predicted amidohydrolase